MSIPALKIPAPTSPRLNRRVLIVCDDIKGSLETVEHLRDLSLDVNIAIYDGTSIQDFPDRAPAAVLCFLSDYIEHGAAIVSDLRCRYSPSEFPVLGRLTRQSASDHPFDSVLYAPVHPVQVAHRIASLIRLGQMEREIVRRMETLQHSFGIKHTLSAETLRRPFRILFIGRADPAYMAVSNALQGQNAELIAAFTSFSAFDYLHDNQFDGVIMNAINGMEPALTISDTMRRNPRLFHVPTFLLVNSQGFNDQDAAYRQGINDIIDAQASAEELSGRILEQANAYRLHEKLKSEFSALGDTRCSDPDTGIFTGKFLAAHLKRVSRDCRLRNVPLTILTLKLVPQSVSAVTGDGIKKALSNCIRLISGIVRMQDIVARIDENTVVIAFPEERQEEVEMIATRIEKLIDDASFQTESRTDSSLTMHVETAIVEQDVPDSIPGIVTSPSRPNVSLVN